MSESPRPLPRRAEHDSRFDPAGPGNGGVSELLKELWNAAVALRGNIEPADYKRYVLPLIFLRFLSLRYEKRRAEIDADIADPKSDLYTQSRQAGRCTGGSSNSED